MKAPDKIFMPNELLSEEWQRHIEGEDTAYIRKDALIEWLENKIKISDVGFIDGLTYLAYKDVIEHLNEM